MKTTRDLTDVVKEMESLSHYDNPKTALVIAAGLLAETLEYLVPTNMYAEAILEAYRKLDNGRVVK